MLYEVITHFDIDLEKAIIDKMKKNEKKYPLFDEDGLKIEYGKKK